MVVRDLKVLGTRVGFVLGWFFDRRREGGFGEEGLRM